MNELLWTLAAFIFALAGALLYASLRILASPDFWSRVRARVSPEGARTLQELARRYLLLCLDVCAALLAVAAFFNRRATRLSEYMARVHEVFFK